MDCYSYPYDLIFFSVASFVANIILATLCVRKSSVLRDAEKKLSDIEKIISKKGKNK